MTLATTLVLGVCVVLALAIVWRLTTPTPKETSHVPAAVAGPLGVAVGIVLWQVAWLLMTTQASDPAASPTVDTPVKLVAAEREAREKDIATVTGHIDGLAKNLSAVQAELGKARSDIADVQEAAKQLASVQSGLGEALKRTDTNISKIIGALPKPPVPIGGLNLNRLENRASQRPPGRTRPGPVPAADWQQRPICQHRLLPPSWRQRHMQAGPQHTELQL